jgi:hypothetical protein
VTGHRRCGHFHIWRQADLPWLSRGRCSRASSAPMSRSAATTRSRNISPTSRAGGRRGEARSMSRPTGRPAGYRGRGQPYVSQAADQHQAGRIAHRRLCRHRGGDVRPQLDRTGKRNPPGARRAHAAALAREPALPLRQRGPISGARSRDPQQTSDTRWRSTASVFELQVFAGRWPALPSLAEACPDDHLRAPACRHAGGPLAAGHRRLAQADMAAGWRNVPNVVPPSCQGSAPSCTGTIQRISPMHRRPRRSRLFGA